MNSSTALRLHVLEKIGAPLVSAIFAANPRTEEGTQAEKDAQTMAALLARAVQAGVALSHLLDQASPEEGDQVRLNLTGLASSLLGGYYLRQGSIPGDAEIKRLTGALQAVIPFAANFSSVTPPASKQSDTPLALLEVFAPLADAIHAFPFGQAEGKLLGDVAGKLMARAKAMRESLVGAQSEPAAEQEILRALAQIYTAAHKAQTAQMLALDADKRTAPESALEQVWQGFEARTAMIAALAQTLIPGGKATGTQGNKKPGVSVAAVSAPPASSTPSSSENPMSLFAKKPAQETSPPPSPESAPEQKPAAGGGPMSFFKKKEGGGP